MVHAIDLLFQKLYLIGRAIPNRDRFGIHARIEMACLELSELAIAAAFAPRHEKTTHLVAARIKTEILKRLARSAHAIHIYSEKNYLELSAALQEISKMLNGWIRYLQTK